MYTYNVERQNMSWGKMGFWPDIKLESSVGSTHMSDAKNLHFYGP